MTGRKIGIMGGTFDPFHNGHMQVAKAALKECALDHVDFIPSASPPHKAGETDAGFSDRVNMINEVCAGITYFSCNDIEGSLQAPSYSIETVNYLQSAVYKNCQLYFIIGIDAFLEIKFWKSFQEVLERIHFIVSKRLGYNSEKLGQYLIDLGYQNKNDCWVSKNNFRNIYLLDTIPAEISSTELKTIMKQGGNIDGSVPLPVMRYIIDNNLYY